MSVTIKEDDIRPAAIFERYLELSRIDTERFFHDRSRFVTVACPACDRDGGHEAFVKDGFRYVDCGCGTLYASPRPDRASLDAFYGDSESATYWAETFFPASVEPRREKIFVPRVERILDLMRVRGVDLRTAVDVGAGYGIFLEELRRRAPTVECLAVEPGRKLADLCRAKGFDTLELPVEDAAAWEGRGDLVVCFEVLEHVFSPIEFVAGIGALAKPGGWIVLTTLCGDGIDIQTLRGRSKSVSPPHHLNFLSVDGLATMCERAGLADVDVMTPGRLDVDIIRNAWRADPAVLRGHRFLETLIARRDTATQEAFQDFLAANRLSSHGWVVARRPA